MRRSTKNRILVGTTLTGFTIGGLIWMLQPSVEPEQCVDTSNMSYYYDTSQWYDYEEDWLSKNYIGELDKISDDPASSIDEDPLAEDTFIIDEPIFPNLQSYPKSVPPTGLRVNPLPPVVPVFPAWNLPPGRDVPGGGGKPPCGQVNAPSTLLLGLFVLLIGLISRR